jgi:N6-adenosine-specific RNA methylase IME4
LSKLQSGGAMALVKYEAAKSALAEAHRVDEVKSIRDKAVAMQAYAKQAKDATLITQATEIRMRAERRAGELLIEMAERGERDSGKGNRNPILKSQAATPKLSELGISKTQSSRWQELARISDHKFEASVTSASKRAYDGIAHRFIKEAEIDKAKQHYSNVIEHGCRADDLVALAESGKRFGVIYADPPWPFATWGESGKGRSPENHYGTNAIDEITKLPVASLAAEDCALLLWCTGPHIAIGSHVKVIEAWGFRPSTIAFDWIKQNPSGTGFHVGMGYWSRSNSEQCFIAIKGSPRRLATDVHQVVMAPVGEHSAKPDEVRARVERLLPGPYLELYGRKPIEGWCVWGNEIVSPLKAPPPAGAGNEVPPFALAPTPRPENWDEMWARKFDFSKLDGDEQQEKPPDDGLSIPPFLRRASS